jgi:hypothetical protein
LTGSIEHLGRKLGRHAQGAVPFLPPDHQQARVERVEPLPPVLIGQGADLRGPAHLRREDARRRGHHDAAGEAAGEDEHEAALPPAANDGHELGRAREA